MIIYPETRPNFLGIGHHKFFLAFCCLWLFGYSAKADVLLANDNTAGQTSVGGSGWTGTNIRFSITGSPAGQSFNLVSLFGVSGQVGKKLNFNLITSGRDFVASETTVGGGSSRYDFDLSSLVGASSLSSANTLAIRAASADTFTSLYTTTTTTSTQNASGWALTGYDGNPLQFQISSVPEPGTLLLGAISSVIGGFGIWYRRRRKARKSIDSV